ncbi:MAG TPA: class I SAM-dependent methyltransferase [Verrucomicrobiae bacterium]|nr:class I SAM-dependent methyltransferase [Verrucomicrobiae bacterium]
MHSLLEENRRLQAKYGLTAWFYDILDLPWELQYRRWRPSLLEDVRGAVLEAGVGTGRNLPYYPPEASVTGIDLSQAMLRRAAKRGRHAGCPVVLRQEDATTMASIPSNHFDWVISTFLCCVMPDHLQPLALAQFARILKPGGRFRLLEIIYSKNPRLRRRQELFAPFVEKIYGARFDRNTLSHVREASKLQLLNTRFLKRDAYLLIEGERSR